ncbi:hypothetical protein [Chitinophaga sp. 212800010-3]|uniref:hypothetical protein n=1 Tax=unclassified Chitinophaga TaxID=2619133 RepID=UPI002DE47CAD|nr:hypothetical protein [Chitinophaga sp. 212800010-3]
MLNCSIYVTGSVSKEELLSGLCRLLNGKITSISFINTSNYELFVQKNDEFDEDEQKSFPDGFLYFRYIVYVEFNDKNTQQYCVEEIAKLLRWLWEKNMAAVASCDYEDLLPENGGYKSRNIPWID